MKHIFLISLVILSIQSKVIAQNSITKFSFKTIERQLHLNSFTLFKQSVTSPVNYCSNADIAGNFSCTSFIHLPGSTFYSRIKLAIFF